MNLLRPSSLESFALDHQSAQGQNLPLSTTACPPTVVQKVPDSIGTYKSFKPSSLIPLPQTPAADQNNFQQCVPQSTRGHSQQLPITPHYQNQFGLNYFQKPKINMLPRTPMHSFEIHK